MKWGKKRPMSTAVQMFKDKIRSPDYDPEDMERLKKLETIDQCFDFGANMAWDLEATVQDIMPCCFEDFSFPSWINHGEMVLAGALLAKEGFIDDIECLERF